VLFTGTKKECQTYMRMNPEICSTFTFLQELDEAYYE
jgi:hypothetical protein